MVVDVVVASELDGKRDGRAFRFKNLDRGASDASLRAVVAAAELGIESKCRSTGSRHFVAAALCHNPSGHEIKPKKWPGYSSRS